MGIATGAVVATALYMVLKSSEPLSTWALLLLLLLLVRPVFFQYFLVCLSRHNALGEAGWSQFGTQ